MNSEELKLLGELNGKMDRVLCELSKINRSVSKHEDRLDEHDRIIQQHRSYFKIIGVVVTAVTSAISYFASKLFFRF